MMKLSVMVNLIQSSYFRLCQLQDLKLYNMMPLYFFSLSFPITVKPSNIPVRLVPPYQDVNFMGRIEVLRNGQWGTVCDDYFSTVDGDVVCGMLNYRGAVCVVPYAYLGRGTGMCQ